jgi:hypothetical protein
MVVVASASVAAQQGSAPVSLGEVARQAEAAKPTVKKARKTYTNADLGADAARESAEAAPATGFMSGSLGKPVTAEEMVSRSEEKIQEAALAAQPEERWRERAESIRVQTAKLQARLNSLMKPNDARSANPAAQARQDAEIANVRTGLAALDKQWAALEDAAREQRIPGGWLDPRPSRQ